MGFRYCECNSNWFYPPIFADINLKTLGMDTEKILEKNTPNTKAVFLSHIQGFNALTNKLIDELKSKKIPLIEDVCGHMEQNIKIKKLVPLDGLLIFHSIMRII